MAKLYAENTKFKRIEATLRETTNGYRKVIAEIDKSLEGPRTKPEISLLNSIRKQCINIQNQSREALALLYDNQ